MLIKDQMPQISQIIFMINMTLAPENNMSYSIIYFSLILCGPIQLHYFDEETGQDIMVFTNFVKKVRQVHLGVVFLLKRENKIIKSRF